MIIQNLKSTLRHYPLASLLNFTGLVCALLCVCVIALQLDWELSFDRCHPTSERVFRVDKTDDESIFRNVLPRGFADDIIVSSSHIESGCIVMPFYGDVFYSDEEGEKSGKRTLTPVSEGFIDVFGVKMLEGDSHALERDASVIIPESLAKSLFPSEAALGKILKIDAQYMLPERSAVIGGVYEDFPTNTQLGNDIYLSLGNLNRGTYGAANFVCYLLLDDPSNAEVVSEEFNSKFDFSQDPGWLSPIELTPLRSIYLRGEGNIYKSGSRGRLALLFAVAILILVIALINFTNFYLALTPLRIRNITLQKVLGASARALRDEVIAEAMIWSLCAFLIAALLLSATAEGLAAEGIINYTAVSQGKIVLCLGVIALVSGAIAGIWPGVYSTSGQSALKLKGNYGLSESGRALRKGLVGVQLTISIALIIFVLFIQKQNRYMQDYPCGYDKSDLAIVDIGGGNFNENSARIRESLKELPEVSDVAYSMELVGGKDVYSTQTYDFGEGAVMFSTIYCTWNFPDVLGVQVIDGRDFQEGDSERMLLSEDLKDSGAELGSEGLDPVVGFVNKLNLTSVRKADSPVAFVAISPRAGFQMPYAYIRLLPGTLRHQAVEDITETLHGIDPTTPFDVLFYDSVGKTLYSAEEKLQHSIALFSLIAILLCIVGVWGQVLMDVQYKRRMIAVKRVFGAATYDISAEGVIEYLKLVGVCFIIGAPIGYIATGRYLSSFAHRVPVSADVFLLTLLFVALLCVVVVLTQYLRAARINPAEGVKKE